MKFEKMLQRIVVCALMLSFGSSIGFSQQPAPPSNVNAFDTPNDSGTSVTITWNKSADDGAGENSVIGYNVLRKTGNADFEVITKAPLNAASTRYIDKGATGGTAFTYVVQAVTTSEVKVDSMPTVPVKAVGNWYHTKKTTLLAAILFFSGVTLVFIQISRGGKKLFIRKIAGLDAVEEAVGRATEMGRPIFFVPGIGQLDSPGTIAGINIFEAVAGYAAADQTKLKAPCADPIVMNVMQNSLKEVYQAAGRPDLFQSEDVYFVNDRQFSYVAAVDGMITREKPAAIFLQGVFYAESLILSEVGNSVGAIQIAGTNQDTQLPFFITACDYTLLGEELYAASAYIKGDPLQIGTLKAQDLVKLILFVLLFAGTILALFDINWILSIFERKW